MNSLEFLGYYNTLPKKNTSLKAVTSPLFLDSSLNLNLSQEESFDISTEYRVDEIWGIIAMIIVFIPGVICSVPWLICHRFQIRSSKGGEILGGFRGNLAACYGRRPRARPWPLDGANPPHIRAGRRRRTEVREHSVAFCLNYKKITHNFVF